MNDILFLNDYLNLLIILDINFQKNLLMYVLIFYDFMVYIQKKMNFMNLIINVLLIYLFHLLFLILII